MMMSSPPASNSVHDKVVYSRLRSVSCRRSVHWFCFDLANRRSNIFRETSSDTTVPEYPNKKREIDPGFIHFENSMQTKCVAMGSLIYLVGIPKAVRNFHYLDTRSDDQYYLLQPAPSMPTHKMNPRTEVLGGKLYVMGDNHGFNAIGPNKWGEVFDPCLNTWKPMPPPPLQAIGPSMTSAVLPDENKILLGADGWTKLYAFDIETESWLVFHDNNGAIFNFGGKGVVVDGIMYSWYSKKLHAYHLRDRWTSGITPFRMGFSPQDCVSIEQEEEDKNRSSPFLLHVVRDEFCLVWMTDAKLHFAIFQVLLSTNRRGIPYLKANITSHFIEDVSIPGLQLVEALLI